MKGETGGRTRGETRERNINNSVTSDQNLKALRDKEGRNNVCNNRILPLEDPPKFWLLFPPPLPEWRWRAAYFQVAFWSNLWNLKIVSDGSASLMSLYYIGFLINTWPRNNHLIMHECVCDCDLSYAHAFERDWDWAFSFFCFWYFDDNIASVCVV